MLRLVKPDMLKADAALLETDRSTPLTCSVRQHKGPTTACHATSCPPLFQPPNHPRRPQQQIGLDAQPITIADFVRSKQAKMRSSPN